MGGRPEDLLGLCKNSGGSQRPSGGSVFNILNNYLCTKDDVIKRAWKVMSGLNACYVEGLISLFMPDVGGPRVTRFSPDINVVWGAYDVFCHFKILGHEKSFHALGFLPKWQTIVNYNPHVNIMMYLITVYITSIPLTLSWRRLFEFISAPLVPSSCGGLDCWGASPPTGPLGY